MSALLSRPLMPVARSTIAPSATTGDIANWTEPLGLTSMVVEGLTIAVALGGAALHRAARAVVA
jgi:hypothetical protein